MHRTKVHGNGTFFGDRQPLQHDKIKIKKEWLKLLLQPFKDFISDYTDYFLAPPKSCQLIPSWIALL